MELSNQQIERYARHLILDQVDEDGQAAILNARVLVVGAGGIGSPALLYLAAAGVGEIHIIDDDVVDLSNLQRQVLFQTEQIGRTKASSAKANLKALNPEVQIFTHEKRLDVNNVGTLVDGMSLVIDGSDTYETRAIVAKACHHAQVPLVSSAATQFDGQLAVFKPWLAERPCYHCLFPEAPSGRTSCAEVGVFGPLVGMMGTMAANEALKLLIGLPINDQQLLLVDGLDLRFSPMKTKKHEGCGVCGG